MKNLFFAGALCLGAVSAQFFPQEIIDRLNEEPQGDRSDAKRTFQEICVENGFGFEEHTVTTEDGYILTVYRIPGMADEEVTGEKPPVFFQHGILDSANCWIMNYPDVAPAFVAARAGYDVWLGNSRGNTYSMGHTSLNPKKNEKKYWAFDWEQMGVYDLPAVIDHIQESTFDQKVAYVGHSQGTTQMFYGLSEIQEYFADKVSIFIALGPVTKISHTESALLQIADDFYGELVHLSELFGIHSLLKSNFLTDAATDIFCKHIPSFCEALGRLIINSDPTLDDNDRFAVYMAHEPNGTSLQSILLYAQNMKENRFQIWDADFMDYFHRDKKRITDLIPIETINQVPVAMFTGIEDKLADLTDSRWTRDQIGADVVHYEEIHAGHLTFMVGKDMTYWTESCMDLLAQYQPLPQSKEFLQ